MSARGLEYLLQDWWIPVMPAIAIFLLALVGEPGRRRPSTTVTGGSK